MKEKKARCFHCGRIFSYELKLREINKSFNLIRCPKCGYVNRCEKVQESFSYRGKGLYLNRDPETGIVEYVSQKE